MGRVRHDERGELRDATALVVDALAAYRLTRLVVVDTITEPLRERVTEDTFVARLIDCPWCVGVWVGLGVAGARVMMPRQWAPVARGLALASVAGILTVIEPQH